ncbi:hypothetical protein VOLCADRAFT_116378 [Volvox carteri f. nagariensis]|uniref:Rab-GAP TBC domain-containing protein n=1 Tax=Volvox carteri f. nagariensis TaxID=3068 RepID=D8TLQ6_VOLCA|nr:uncharacterized protein VOLCADRAFT_116378 [Volvox carteri f. nagariensis]EFJ51370.1 hypothetical protein VOLCADRAFT_116378 [Volvox carteri f. nagariensis]|eukprot:XP_002947322.1 hypothetical protein VOLCADRAFT_116378 [Volvox carteri f. nagariensis]
MASAPHDIYGFPISYKGPHQAFDYQRAQNLYAVQEKAWEKYAAEKRLSGGKSKLKKLIRRGVPPKHRHWVWFEVSGAKQLMASQPGNSYYSNLVKAAASMCKVTAQVELDLPRTFPGHPYLSCPETGQAAMRRILTSYSLRNPKVGYCQGLNFVVGVILLAVERDEECTFWLLAALVEKICYQGSFGDNLCGCHVEMKTLQDLVHAKIPKLGAHMKATNCDMSLVATDWFLTLYCVSMPAESACRVLDALLNEGAKVLFRVALALLKTAENRLLQLDNAGELMKWVKDFVGGILHIDPLMQIAFGGIGGLSLSRVEAVRKVKAQEVQAFMDERRERMSPRTEGRPGTLSPGT